MNLSLLLIPTILAIVGWAFNTILARQVLKNYIPKKTKGLSKEISKKAALVFPFAKIEEKISSPALIEKAMPMIEHHIDEFLSVQLPQEIPMLAMFVGYKTTDKVKEVFVAQLRQLFPKVMTNLTANFKDSFDIEKTLALELEQLNLSRQLQQQLTPMIWRFQLAGLIQGIISGLISLTLFCIFT